MRFYCNKLSNKELLLLKSIFKTDQHFVTLSKVGASFAHRFKWAKDSRFLKRANKQEAGSNIYISKYSTDLIVDTIILDFDSERKSIAYKDVKKCIKHLKKHDLTYMVVDSTNKGFHLYVRIPPYSFKHNTMLLDLGVVKKISYDKRSTNQLFVYYQRNLIGDTKYHYQSLDKTNLNAGLRGIIRLPFSVHPKTDSRVEVKFNNLREFQPPTDYQFKCYKIALESVKEDLFKQKQKIKEYERKKIKGTKDIVMDNDLRSLMPSIFGGDVRNFSDYIYMTCPFHPDSHPSLAVEKERFTCKSCGTKGNIWYLIKNDYISYNEV